MTMTNTLVAQIRAAIRLQAALVKKAPFDSLAAYRSDGTLRTSTFRNGVGPAPIHSTHTAATFAVGAL